MMNLDNLFLFVANSAKWCLISLLGLPVIVFTTRSSFEFKYNAIGKCSCNKTYEGPAFITSELKDDEIPLQCPQNIRNWKGVRDFLKKVESDIVNHCAIADSCRRVGKTDNQDRLGSEFDFIVVGGGTAGAIVAGRLAVDTTKSVLLLEAGDAEPIYSRVPAFFKYYRYNNRTDWMYKTKVSVHNCLASGGQCRLPRGMAMGGTAMYNDMIYQRGHPYDCGNWFRAVGQSYTCRDFEPFYRKFENHLAMKTHDKNIYGTEGPMPLSRLQHRHKMIYRLIQAAKDIGIKYIEDLMDKNTLSGGLGLATTFTANGQRFTTARTYLHPNKSNLLIVLKAHVNKIVFDNNREATAVEYVLNRDWDHKFYVHAREEIILSAGSFNSPKILMLSGIGPKDDLERLNISVIKDLPVGQNLQSHYGFRMRYGIGYHADHKKKKWSYVRYFFSSAWKFLWHNAMVYFHPNKTMKNIYLSDTLNKKALNKYLMKGTGPLSSNGLTQLIGMFTSNLTKNKNKPDIQLIFSGLQTDCSRTDEQNLTQAIEYYYPSHEGDRVYNGTGYRKLNQTPYGTKLINVDVDAFAGRKIDAYIILLNPRSVGNVTLNSSDPKDAPIIEPNYLEDEDDVNMLIEGGKIVDELFLAKSMKNLKMEMPVNYFRPCTTYEYYPKVNKPHYAPGGYFYSIPNRDLNQKFFTCLAEHYTVGEFHQQGTAAIGDVVNENLLVRGVGKVRVVDGSVIPTTISGSPQATIMMLAEKAVDMITEELRVS